MYGDITTATAPPPPAPRVRPTQMRQNLHPTDAHRREHDISRTLCAEDCGQRIGAGLWMAWRLTSEPSSPRRTPPPELQDGHALATCALGSALGSQDVGGVGGVLLDLGGFFARQLPPEGQVEGFLHPPCPLTTFSRFSRRVKRHSPERCETDFHGSEGLPIDSGWGGVSLQS